MNPFEKILNFIEKYCLWFLCAVVLTFFFWLFCVNHVSPNEIGVAYDRTNGKITTQPVGWHVTAPYVKTTTISELNIPVNIAPLSVQYSYPGLKPYVKWILLKIKPEKVESFFNQVGFQYLFIDEQTNFMTAAYFQDVRPDWLEIVEE